MTNDPELQFAERTARAAGQVLMDFFLSPLKIYNKGEHDIVTEADMAAEALILQQLAQSYPTDRIHSEESTKDDLALAERVWVIDPLDGTANFSIGFPHFAVAIALVANQRPEVGCVYVPVLDQCFSARRGVGAYLNGEQFHCDENADPTNIMLIMGGASAPTQAAQSLMTSVRDVLPDVPRLRIYGAMAPDICYSASKRGLAALFANFSPWDIAAAGLIAEEAGNRVTNFSGAPWNITEKECLSAPPALHDYLFKRLVL